MKPETWKELILADKGVIPLSRLLAVLLSVEELRKLASSHGLKLKGGFRVQKAQSGKLAELLGETALSNDRLRDELANELAKAAPTSSRSSKDPDASQLELERTRAKLESLTLKSEKAEQKLMRERGSAKKARKSLAAVLEKQQDSQKELDAVRAECRQLQRRLDRQSDELSALEAKGHVGRQEGLDRASLLRRQTLLEAKDAKSRKKIAILSSRERELEGMVHDLEALLPRGQKERWRLKKRSLEPLPAAQVLLPRFTEAFLRSLEHLNSADVRRVYIAIAQMILMGQDYPGLHAKNLKGMGGLLSVRAGMHLRLYFLREGDNVDFLHAGSREEQPTYFKKLKE